METTSKDNRNQQSELKNRASTRDRARTAKRKTQSMSERKMRMKRVWDTTTAACCCGGPPAAGAAGLEDSVAVIADAESGFSVVGVVDISQRGERGKKSGASLRH